MILRCPHPYPRTIRLGGVADRRFTGLGGHRASSDPRSSECLFLYALNASLCQGKLFADREVKLNTSGAEFLGFGWANQSAKGLVCQRCGYVHLFMPGMVRMREPAKDVSSS